jgi:hypothetical protein
MPPILPDHAVTVEPMSGHPKGDFDALTAVWRRAGAHAGGRSEGRGNGIGDASRVEVAFVGDLIGVRNGDEPEGPILVFTRAEWEAFVAGAKDGEFDLP